MSETACELHGVASAKTLNIFKRRIRKNGISLMIARDVRAVLSAYHIHLIIQFSPDYH